MTSSPHSNPEHSRSALEGLFPVSMRRWAPAVLRIAVFTGLLVASAAVGKIPLPGNPVGITLQTFALMLTALSLSPREAVASVCTYLALGGIGLPVFSGGAATAAFVGPSAGFLIGFVPAVAVTAVLKQRFAHDSSITALLLSFVATAAGCVVVPLLTGVPIQSMLTGVSLHDNLMVSLPFVPNDLLKAVVAVGIVFGARKLGSAFTRSSQNHA